MTDIIIVAGIGAAVFLIVRRELRRLRRGGGCASCGGNAGGGNGCVSCGGSSGGGGCASCGGSSGGESGCVNCHIGGETQEETCRK
ncbi:MAG: hypothetical protein OSJ69_09290 [Acetatifactor sp.]|nr:hypothetical protein [Acetatifactor sp.]